MVTKEQVLQQTFDLLIDGWGACNDVMGICDMDVKTPVKTATGWNVVDGIEYKLKMTVEIVSERKVEEEYKRAETTKQLVDFCKATGHEVQISEMTAQTHLQEFNEGMATLESENRSVIDVDLWIADFVNKINRK
jgi:hypothetical protein